MTNAHCLKLCMRKKKNGRKKEAINYGLSGKLSRSKRLMKLSYFKINTIHTKLCKKPYLGPTSRDDHDTTL